MLLSCAYDVSLEPSDGVYTGFGLIGARSVRSFVEIDLLKCGSVDCCFPRIARAIYGLPLASLELDSGIC